MDLSQYWQLFANSRLVDPPRISELRSRFESEQLQQHASPTAADLGDWLVNDKVLTEFQAEILRAGHAGPFVFGNYIVEERFDSPLLPDSFLAIHRPSGHPVLLQFVPGKESADLERWRDLESLGERLSRAQSRHLVPVFETVVLPNHRMIVTGRPFGKPLSERLPRKSRMPWKDACLVFAQIADGLHAIHEQSIIHNAISPRAIWLGKGGLAQIRMALVPDTAFERPDLEEKFSESRLDYMAPEAYVETTVDTPILSRQSDLYSLGCTIFRALAGRVVFEEPDLPKKRYLHETATIADLNKYELPEALESLLLKMLAKKPEYRPASAAVVAKTLAELAGGKLNVKPIPGISPEITPSYQRLTASLQQWNPSRAPMVEELSLPIGQESESPASDLPASDRIEAARLRAEKRKKSQWMLPAAIFAGLLVLSGVIGMGAYLANRTPSAGLNMQPRSPEPDEPLGEGKTNPENTEPAEPIRVVQQLINDDRVSLWESPTSGQPVAFQYLPTAPKLVFAMRPAALMETAEGPRILESLGPDFNSQLEEWKSKLGLELEDLARLTISLHSNEQLQYDFVFLAELPQAAQHERLLQLWRSPTEIELPDDQRAYEAADGTLFYLVPNTESATQATHFLNGPPELIKQVVAAKGITAWSGSMRRMGGWFDRDRHFTVAFLRPALFNDEGQWLMGSQWWDFNRGLSTMLDNGIRGGVLSFHIDEGNYLELIVDRSAELKATDLKESLDSSLREQRDAIARAFENAPSSPFWDEVRRRAPLMLANVYGNLRIDVEYGNVTANCWLPAMAAHNLIAAAELTSSFASGGSSSPTPAVSKNIPQTIEELLQAPRDLTVNTSPDMNILLDGIRNEIVDDFAGLPFDFQIRLLGNDLSKEGITQNQRPSDFELKQTSLADIMTEIMVRCNPKKDISGPEDPECKLVWVLGDDPESPGNKAILVTTRAAAAAKGYTLPPAFQPKSNPE